MSEATSVCPNIRLQVTMLVALSVFSFLRLVAFFHVTAVKLVKYKRQHNTTVKSRTVSGKQSLSQPVVLCGVLNSRSTTVRHFQCAVPRRKSRPYIFQLVEIMQAYADTTRVVTDTVSACRCMQTLQEWWQILCLHAGVCRHYKSDDRYYVCMQMYADTTRMVTYFMSVDTTRVVTDTVSACIATAVPQRENTFAYVLLLSLRFFQY
jgi:hypothetical protein